MTQDASCEVAVDQAIFVLRGQRVIADSDLAQLYGVETKYLNRAVKRNPGRFPADFCFQLDEREHADLRCHFGTSSPRHGGRRTRPLVFTEHGAIMAANVLKSERAAAMSIYVVRAFVRMRELVKTDRRLFLKLDEMEKRIDGQDAILADLIAAVRGLLDPVETRSAAPRRAGFHPDA